MASHPSITAQKLKTALIEAGIVTEAQLTSLLGQQRKNLTLNALELALVRENVLSNERILEFKATLSGLPVLSRGAAKPTAHLDIRTARNHGAIVLDRHPLTVAMVEDTQVNMDAVSAAASGQPFEVWLVTASQFKELLEAAYHNKDMDDREYAADLYDVLDIAIAERASDIHLAVGVPPRIRVDGGLRPLNFKPVDRTWLREQVEELAEARHLKELEETFSTDLAYSYGTGRFRVNVGNDTSGLTMAMRKLPSVIPTADEIGLPDSIRAFAHLERGMVLVTGPTGSGKSTTLAAVLNEIIHSSERHIITLEDPIEFRFPTNGPSQVNQRELGQSFPSFADGIRDAMRQDPDVILVGELRDAETIGAALKAAETGHLCIGTLHTYDAPSTIMRLVNTFPSAEQDAVRAQLSQLLKGVVSQTLVPKASTKGRVAAFEIMVNSTAISTNLRKTDGHNQIKQTMQTSDGMQTMELGLALLVHRGLISLKEAAFRARDLPEFQRNLEHLETNGEEAR